MFFDFENRQCLFGALISKTKDFIYHIRGEYPFRSTASASLLLPVTRSYRSNPDGSWMKAQLPHDAIRPGNSLGTAEVSVSFFAKHLLCVEQHSIDSFASTSISDTHIDISVLGPDLLDIQSSLCKYIGRIGIFGSYQCGFAQPLSDADFIVFADSEAERREAMRSLNTILRKKDWIKSSDDGRDLAYGERYSKKLDISRTAGRYLAGKRIRWTSPRGRPVSFQIVIDSQGRQFYTDQLGLINPKAEFESIPVDTRVHVLDASYSFNFPRLWTLECGNSQIMALSFEWGHQGMGHETGIDFRDYRVKAIKIMHGGGEFLFLSSVRHYILPEEIV